MMRDLDDAERLAIEGRARFSERRAIIDHAERWARKPLGPIWSEVLRTFAADLEAMGHHQHGSDSTRENRLDAMGL